MSRRKIINYYKCFNQGHQDQMILCSPKGPKMKRYFSDLEILARYEKIQSPPKPGEYCIGGIFCCCCVNSSSDSHLRDFYLLLDWCYQFNFTDHIEEFIKNLNDDELLINPILSLDNLVPSFNIQVKNKDDEYELAISSEEIRRIDPQVNSFPPKKIDFINNPWLENVWNIQEYDKKLIHLPSRNVLQIL